MSIAVGLIGKDSIVLATDSRVVSQASGGGGRTHHDNIIKLWSIGKKTAVAGVGNIGGYEARIVDLVQRKIQNNEITVGDDPDGLSENFAECVKEDWIKWMGEGQMVLLGNNYYLIEFILVGYDRNGTAIMRRIYWDNRQQVFAPRLVKRPYYITGVPFVAEYWMRRLKTDLPSYNDRALKRVATFLITESAIEHDEIGGDIQMMISKRDADTQTVSKDELTQLREEAMTALDTSGNLLIKKLLE